MNYGQIFSHSWQLVWRHKFLWWLGMAVGLGSILFTPFRLAYSTSIIQLMRDPAGMTAVVSTTAESELWLTWLLAGGVGIFIVSIGYWLLVTMAEGAIIGAVADLAAERPSSLRSAWRHGVGLLGRFIAIDTVVFFPWFILALALLLLALVGMVVITGLAMQGGSIETALILAATGSVCLLPLLLLLLPVGTATTIFRTLAFRDAAMGGTGVRDSVKHTWQIIRRQWGAVLVLLLLLWGVQSGAGLLLSMLTGLVMGMTAVSPIVAHWLGWLVGVVTAVPLAILHTFVAVVWTVAYSELTELQSGRVAK